MKGLSGDFGIGLVFVHFGNGSTAAVDFRKAFYLGLGWVELIGFFMAGAFDAVCVEIHSLWFEFPGIRLGRILIFAEFSFSIFVENFKEVLIECVCSFFLIWRSIRF